MGRTRIRWLRGTPVNLDDGSGREIFPVVAVGTGYQMLFTPLREVHGSHFNFIYNLSGVPIKVTARDLARYNPLIVKQRENPGKIIEVGAGLGNLVPSITSGQRPVVIDPVNYRLLVDIIDFVSEGPVGEDDLYRENLHELRERAVRILDPKRIELVNLPLREALEQRTDLLRSADAVVDNFGPTRYDGVQIGQEDKEVIGLEMELLKKGGRLYLPGKAEALIRT